jgi:hypothetical protein
MRTPRGRCLSIAGWDYLGMAPPAAAARQLDLLAIDTDGGQDDSLDHTSHNTSHKTADNA